MTDSREEDRIRALLRGVETEPLLVSPNRSRIRAEVLAALGDAVASREDLSSTPGGDIEVVEFQEHDRSRSVGPRLIGWAAAIVVAVAVAVLLASADRTIVDPIYDTDPSPDVQRRFVAAGEPLPAELEAGLHLTDVIGGGLSFSASAPFAVLEEHTGRLTLSDAPSGSRAELLIVAVDAVDVDKLIEDMEERGEVITRSFGLALNDGAISRWDISLTTALVAELDCSPRQPCLELAVDEAGQPVMLWAGAENRLLVLGRSDTQVVLAIERSQQFSGSISRLTADLTSTVDLTLD